MKYKTKKAKNKKLPYLVILGAIIAFIIAAALVWFFVFAHKATTTITKATASTGTVTKASDGSTDKTDKSDDTQANGASTTSTSTAPTTASVVIVDASQYGSEVEVRSYVDSLSDGTCTYTFTLGSEKVVKQTATASSGNTTSCTTLDVATSEFATSGDWQLTVSYQSSSNTIVGQVTKTVAVQKG